MIIGDHVLKEIMKRRANIFIKYIGNNWDGDIITIQNHRFYINISKEILVELELPEDQKETTLGNKLFLLTPLNGIVNNKLLWFADSISDMDYRSSRLCSQC